MPTMTPVEDEGEEEGRDDGATPVPVHEVVVHVMESEAACVERVRVPEEREER